MLHCVLRLDALPVRCMCADDHLVYLAEAPLRGHAGHSTPGGHTGRLTARDPTTGRVSRQLGSGGNSISCVLVVRDEHVWHGSFDGLLHVIRRGGQPLHEARAHAACVHALVEGVEAVFSSGGDFLVRAWSRSLVPLRTLRAHTSSVHCLAAPLPPSSRGYTGETFSQGGAGVWSGGDDNVIHVWSGSEAAGFAHVSCVEDFDAPLRVLASQDSSAPRIWAACAAGGLRVYDARTRSVLRTLVSPGGGAPTTCIACSPSATTVWVGDFGGSITVFDGGSLAKLQRLEGVHTGAVGGLAAPRAGSATASPSSAAVVWSFGADCSLRAWGMSERLHERFSRTREAIDGQHRALTMMRSLLPRAAAATAGRLEAAAQRSEMLTRRLLDLDVSMSVGGAVGDVYRAGGVGMPPPSGRVSAGTDGGESALAADAKRRAMEYEASVGALNQAHQEVASEVEEALLALRGRVDELLAFVQGAPSSERQPQSAEMSSMPELHAPMWAAPSPRRQPSNAP